MDIAITFPWTVQRLSILVSSKGPTTFDIPLIPKTSRLREEQDGLREVHGPYLPKNRRSRGPLCQDDRAAYLGPRPFERELLINHSPYWRIDIGCRVGSLP